MQGAFTLLTDFSRYIGAMMKEKIRENIENELNTKLTDEQFEEAYEMAAMKQQFIFAREHRNVIMSIWYLEMLVLEYVRNLAFSHYTMDLCEVCGNKKEHLSNTTSTHKTTSYCSTASL